MPQLIKDGHIVDDTWQYFPELQVEEPLPQGQVLVPLNYWQAHAADLADNKNVGVWIAGDTDLTDIGAALAKLPVVGVFFPAFMDGRGFSTGRLLRERYQFAGELRALGNFIRDQLCYLRRCGFNAFQFAEEENLETALQSLSDFQEYYQAAVDEPLPLFRRRKA